MKKNITETEYFESIARIRGHTAAGDLEEAERLLEQMYMYKPVRLLWFLAKAECILKRTGDAEEALDFLKGKYFPSGDYPGMKECMQFRVEMLKRCGRIDDAIRDEYFYQRVCGSGCPALENTLMEALEGFAEHPDSKEAFLRLGDAFFHTSDITTHLIVRFIQQQFGILAKGQLDVQPDVIPNFGYLEKKMASAEASTFILLMDKYLECTLEILGSLLSSLGHRVFLLTSPLPFETTAQLDLKDTVTISLEQAEQFPGVCVVPPIVLSQNGVPYGDNRGYLIDYICKQKSERDNAVIFCSGHLLEHLCVREELRGRMGRLSVYTADFLEEKLHFGWAGSYLSYISDIYGYDVRTDLDAPTEVDFSIVIPARNSTDTLRHTLETCLNQRYKGSYEIVVSDNSVDQDTGVYELCQELNDPHIRYIRTPQLLQLPKSFEFAYLKTRGTFVLSIGSDDAILPWGLETIKQVLDLYPDEDILQWERGFYAWPGFNGGQENMFQIPRKYRKGQVPVYQKKTEIILGEVAKDIKHVYILPMLYINSGFRRRYMNTLLQRTGKLWNGANQDMQMGINNCCLYDHILQLVYPITIAGMSSASMGHLGQGLLLAEKKEQLEKLVRRQYQQDNIGIYVPLERERQLILMSMGLDAYSLYMVLSRAVEDKLLSADAADRVLDWKKAVKLAFESYLVINDNYDAFVHSIRFAAGQLGGQLNEWFEQCVYQTALTPRYIDEKKIKQIKSYQEETDELGGETLDASQYGVRNIADAAKLFAARTEL